MTSGKAHHWPAARLADDDGRAWLWEDGLPYGVALDPVQYEKTLAFLVSSTDGTLAKRNV